MDRGWPESRPAEESDFLLAATPLKLLFRIAVNHITPSLAEQDKEMLDGLRKAGYLTGWGEEMGYGPIGQLGLISTKLGGFCELTHADWHIGWLTLLKIWTWATHRESLTARLKSNPESNWPNSKKTA